MFRRHTLALFICRTIVVLLMLGALFAPSIHHWSELAHENAHGHSHAHHQDSGATCSDLAEQDPCHRALVHNDPSAGCSHDTHLSTLHTSCELCSVLPIRQEGIIAELRTTQVSSVSRDIIRCNGHDAILPASRDAKSSRGPPAVCSLLNFT